MEKVIAKISEAPSVATEAWISSSQVSAIASSVSAVAAIIALGGIYFAWRQVKVMLKTLTSDHERSRRITSIEMLHIWHERLSKKASSSRKLVEEFNFQQAKAVYKQEKIEIELRLKEKFFSIFPEAENDIHNPIEETASHFSVPEKYSALLRWELVTYLNTLETVLSAWNHNVADREMIEEQFEYFISPEDNHYMLQEFRTAAGGSSSYPCTEIFIEHLKSKRSLKSGKEKIA
jgi:hypothetical protein